MQSLRFSQKTQCQNEQKLLGNCDINFFFSLPLCDQQVSFLGLHVPCCWAELSFYQKRNAYSTWQWKGNDSPGFLCLGFSKSSFSLLTFFFTVWTHEHLPPRFHDTIFISSVTSGYWAKPCLMRHSISDKPALAYFWFPTFTNLHDQKFAFRKVKTKTR